jgi:hypothetical protein
MGAIVCELEGPGPALNNSKMEVVMNVVMGIISGIKIPLYK